MRAVFAVSVLSASLQAVNAWGTLGHTTVAYIAQGFLTPAAKKFTQGILNDTSATYLVNVATWADSYRYTAEGAFSAAYHYIDALDDPPNACNVDFERDCTEEGCIVSAIGNYSQRVTDKKLDQGERQKALKWIIHFLGDIHQPLHNENLAIGGNTINVTFAGAHTNLHHIWDTEIPEKFVGGYNASFQQSWASNLTTALRFGKFGLQKFGWLPGMNIHDPIATAMVWTRDTNRFVCSTVVPGGVPSVENQELSGTYASKAFPVVEKQIAKGGYRLAAWLNLLASAGRDDGCDNLTKQPLNKRDAEAAAFVPSETKEEMKIKRDAVKAKRADLESSGYRCDHSH